MTQNVVNFFLSKPHDICEVLLQKNEEKLEAAKQYLKRRNLIPTISRNKTDEQYRRFFNHSQ